MEKRCYGCMKTYNSTLNVCPYCGYVEGTKPENPMHLACGTILNNRYEVGKVIGYGGFGVTYSAWDKVLEQKVAIKEYLPSDFSTRAPGISQVSVYGGDKGEQFGAGLDKFIDEARGLAKFTNCSGIVKVYDCFKENDTAYIVMEYIEGVTLSKYIKDRGKIPPEEAVMMMLPVIDSLEKVNKAGIIHRDIAPDNIMVTNDGEVKVIDFGAARYATTTHSMSLTVIVKPGYSPEEQYRSRGSQGAYTDVYAVGATLYKMITGVTPPDALERRAHIENEGKNTLQPPSKYVKGVSKNLDNAIMNAMHIRVDKRTKDMRTLMYELTTDNVVKLSDEGISRVFDPRKWPVWLKIAVPVMAALVVTLSVLFATGVIGFNANRQDDIYTELGMVRVPWIVNKELEEAELKLNEKTLSYSIAGKEYSSDVPMDRVLTQDIEGAMPVKENTVLNITISGGVETKIFPQVEESDYRQTKQKLEDMGFSVVVSEDYSDVIAEGGIISRRVNGLDVHPGDEIEVGSEIELVISKGRDPQNQLVEQDIIVPDFTGMTYDEALAAAQQAGIVVSILENRYSDTFDVDVVMEQDVEVGSTIRNTQSVGLVVSLGIKTVKVPDVQYKDKDTAIRLLTENELTYTIVEKEVEKVDAGCVASQSIERGTKVAPGTSVELVISLGAPKKDVPDVTGMDEAAAKSALSELGFTVDSDYANSEKVESGKVISQNIVGTKAAKPGETIMLLVSTGEELVGVPNVVGCDRTTAENALKNMGFAVMVDEQYSETVEQGMVISQSKTAGTNIKKNSTVLIVVSKGAQSVTSPDVGGKDSKVTVPNVVDTDRASAEKMLSDSGLSVSVSEQYSDTVQEGYVISQDIKGGSQVKKGSTVTIIVSKEQELAEVPNVVGMNESDAESELKKNGFNVNKGTAEYSDEIPEGAVISQSVSAGSKAAKNSTVTIVVSKGAGALTISFDSNGGSSVESIMVKKGDALDELPTPTKDYCDFAGWMYNGADASGMTVSEDITLTASWVDKAESDWVVESSMPQGAKVVSEKWTYTMTTTDTLWSTESTPDGYTMTGNTQWQQTGTGTSYYCNGFPDGEYQNNANLLDSQPYTAVENETYKCEVVTQWAGYVYWHWMYNSGGTEYGQYTRNISQRSGYGTAIKNFYYNNYGEFTSTTDYQQGSSGYNNNTGWTTYVNTGRTSYEENQGTDRWFRFDYYSSTYTEYVKSYEYSKVITENLESSSLPSGEGIENVQRLVRYISK